MRASSSRPVMPALLLLVAVGTMLLAGGATADVVTFTGAVTYQGTYSGDTLYVAVLDTTGVEDVTILDIEAISVSSPPFTESYSLTFDNAGVAPDVLIASFLDVDGGGVDDIGGADVFGWYGEGKMPVSVSSATSQAGLDLELPRAEIRGTITFTPDQIEARIDVSHDLACMVEGFRPGTFELASGTYAIIGVYPGSYCISADGSTMGGSLRVCYGDPTCESPVPVTLTETEVRTGVDLDFTLITPVERSSWGGVKALYR